MKECLEILANLAEILTASVAVAAAAYFAQSQRSKRIKLEDYLRTARIENPQRHTYTALHITAKLGLTESEILNASFNSRHIVRLEHVNEDTNLTDQILFEYRT